MKNIILLFVCMCLFISVQAQLQTQKVTVVDQHTLQPLSNVQIFKANEGYPFAVSGDDGIIQVKDCAPSQEIYFRNPNFELNFTTLEKLKSVNYTVKMIKKFNEIDEIVVSASRFEEKKQDVSQKIQVLSAQVIQDMNQSSTADVLANSGNVMVQKSQLGGGSPIIRGFETNKVLMVVDGVRLNNAIYRGGHLQNVLTLDNAIMDRVEIVYGPGSVVYGSDALGGVMSFTTKNPLLSKSGKLVVRSNAYTRYMSAVSGYAAHADVAVGGKKFGSLTSFTYSNFGDLRQGAARASEVGNFGARTWSAERINGVDSMVMNKDTNLQVGSGYSQYDILQKFLFQQKSTVKHTLNLQYSTSSNIDRYDRLTLLSGTKPKFAEWYYGPQKRLMTSYTLELSKATKMYDNARLILAYQQIEESRIDRKFKNNNLNIRIENLDVYTLNLDFLKYLGNHELKYGVDGWYNKVNSTAFTKNIATGVQSPLDTRYASGGATMQSIAVFATDKWIISDKIIVNSGLRYSNVLLNAKFTDTTFFNFPFKDANQNNNALTGNIGLIYKPSIETRLTAVFSTGFRAPNVDDLSKVFESTPGNITVPNSTLKPEYTYNGEVGITHSFSDALNIQVNGYYTWYRNALTTQNFTYNGQDSILYGGTMSQVVATTNANKAFMYGLELAINGRLNYNVSYYATYNYTHARIVSDNGIVPLDHIPPVFGKFGIQVIDRNIKADLFVNYSGAKDIKDYSSSGEDNEAYALPTGMPSWFTINAKLNYQFNKFIGIQVACENILDQNYRVFASNISAPGRNFIVTLRGSF